MEDSFSVVDTFNLFTNFLANSKPSFLLRDFEPSSFIQAIRYFSLCPLDNPKYKQPFLPFSIVLRETSETAVAKVVWADKDKPKISASFIDRRCAKIKSISFSRVTFAISCMLTNLFFQLKRTYHRYFGQSLYR